MRTRPIQCLALVLCMGLPGIVAYAGTPDMSAPSKAARGDQRRKTVTHKRTRGQKAMSAGRVRQIQAALIRERYLTGRANGVWDQRSRRAMASFQSDNGWQSRVVPDSRALMKLGLGPAYVGLINPDTAVISFVTAPAAPTSARQP